MQTKFKISLFGLLFILGVAFFSYGSFINSADISVQAQDNIKVITKTEPELIKLVSIGGLKADESGKIEQTFGEDEKPPETCAT